MCRHAQMSTFKHAFHFHRTTIYTLLLPLALMVRTHRSTQASLLEKVTLSALFYVTTAVPLVITRLANASLDHAQTALTLSLKDTNTVHTLEAPTQPCLYCCLRLCE